MEGKFSVADCLSVQVAIMVLGLLQGCFGSKMDVQSIGFQRCGSGPGGQALLTLGVRSRLECLASCARTSGCSAASVMTSHPPGTVTCHLHDESVQQCGQASTVEEILYIRNTEQSGSEEATTQTITSNQPSTSTSTTAQTTAEQTTQTTAQQTTAEQTTQTTAEQTTQTTAQQTTQTTAQQTTQTTAQQTTQTTAQQTTPTTAQQTTQTTAQQTTQTTAQQTTQTTAQQTTQTTAQQTTQTSTASATTTSVMTCENGGTLTAGTCTCVQGFAGSRCERRWKDCTEGQDLSGSTQLTGAFLVQPTGAASAFEVYCTGEWTRIHFRVPSQVASCPEENFNRSWNDYKTGFGKFPCSFWLGNEQLYYLTNQGNYVLTVRTQFDNDTGSTGTIYRIDYSFFRVESEANGYRLLLGSPLVARNLPDAFDSTGSTPRSMHNQKFGTFDKDVSGCAVSTRSGWWFNTACSAVNLNVPDGTYVSTQGGSQRLVWPLGQPNSSAYLFKPAMGIKAQSYI